MTATGKLSFLSFTPVVPMTLGAAILVVLVSLITPPPSQETINRYFARGSTAEPRPALQVAPAR
jgi:hypothetical protein